MKTLTFSLFLVSTAAFAAETHVIKPAMFPAVGTTVRTWDITDMRAVAKIVAADGNTVGTKKMIDVSETIYRETRLDAGRVERTYELAKKSDGQKETREPYESRKLIFTLAPVGVKPAQGPAIDPAVLEKLKESFSRSVQISMRNLCIPTTPLALGQKWRVSKADADLCFNPFADGGGQGAEATGKFTGITKRDGVSFAQIEFKVVVDVASVGPLTFDKPGKLEETLSFEMPLDGTSIGKVAYSGMLTGMTSPQPENGSRLRMEFHMKGQSITSRAK